MLYNHIEIMIVVASVANPIKNQPTANKNYKPWCQHTTVNNVTESQSPQVMSPEEVGVR
jgi:hypothetical protein